MLELSLTDATSDDVLLYVYKRGQFLSHMRNALTNIPDIDHIVDISIKIEVINLIPTPHMGCDITLKSFDSSLEGEALNQLNNDCQISDFHNKSNRFETCGTNKSMAKVLEKYKNKQEFCLQPCSQVKVGLTLNPVNWLQSLVNSKVPVMTVIPGYYMTIPRTVLVSRMHDSYTTISFIAELGGWVGLFLGVSVLGVYDFLAQMLPKTCRNKIWNFLVVSSRVILKFSCIICATFIFCKCVKKMSSNEKTTNVYIQEKIQNISISFCSLTNVYAVTLQGPQTYYIANNSGFWQDTTSLKEKMESLVVRLSERETVSVYNSSLNSNSKFFLFSVNIPKYKTYIESCHSLDLQNWKNIDSMEIKLKKDLIIYVHITGQLLRPEKQGFAFINKDTVRILR